MFRREIESRGTACYAIFCKERRVDPSLSVVVFVQLEGDKSELRSQLEKTALRAEQSAAKTDEYRKRTVRLPTSVTVSESRSVMCHHCV